MAEEEPVRVEMDETAAEPDAEEITEIHVPQKRKDGYYDEGEFLEVVNTAEQLPLESCQLVHILSLESNRRNNIMYIADDVLLNCAGNTLVFIQLPDMSQTYLTCIDGGGIGAVAVHPSRKFFAVASKCRNHAPNVYIYSYPILKLVKVLRSGTEHGYTAAAFNEAGDKLATVGGFPDYLLTLWDWQEEAIILRSKAFSQDVYTVRFSPYFDGFLTTSGMGHIRFWKMASTFTGLKLQGQIGKFGNVELSDVAAFVEMPDGKVLSGTESGDLLMWDGGLIKVVLTRPNGKPCHDGAIEVLSHDKTYNCIVSGGADGYIRLWDFTRVNEAEPEEDSHSLAVIPMEEVLVKTGAKIKSLLWERRQWVVLDEAGAFYHSGLPDVGRLSESLVFSELQRFHSGGLVGMFTSPQENLIISADSAGGAYVFDYMLRKLVYSTCFNSSATAVARLPVSVDPSTRFLLMGFRNGVLRGLLRCAEGWKLVSAHKPHKAAIMAIASSPSGTRIATLSKDGTIFLFAMDQFTLLPLAFSSIPAMGICAVWSTDGNHLMVGCRDATVLEVTMPTEMIDTTHTYEASFPCRKIEVKVPKPKRPKKKKAKDENGEGGEGGNDAGGEVKDQDKKPESDESAAVGDENVTLDENGNPVEKEKEEEEEEPAGDLNDQDASFDILTIQCSPKGDDSLWVTCSGRAAGNVWHIMTAEPLATAAVPSIQGAPTSSVSFNHSGTHLLFGSMDGRIRVQPLAEPYGAPLGLPWESSLHDMLAGRVTSVQLSFDDTFLFSASMDGTLFMHTFNIGGGHSYQQPTAANLPTAVTEPAPQATDIVGNDAYTIEEAKQKAEHDLLIQQAEAKKMGVREYLTQIRAEFEALLAENDNRPEAERLPRSEFEVDPGLREVVEEETRKREEVARLEMAWDTAKKQLAVKKMKDFFLEKVEVERIVLHCLKSKSYVTTFRTPKLPDELLAEVAAIRNNEALHGGETMDGSGARLRNRSESMRTGLGERKSGVPQGMMDAVDEQSDSKLTKADMRRLARKRREAAWAAFMATKPDEQYENPADVEAIAEAERNMGDFKLKSDPNYVVPEEQRMTPQRKRAQMLLLEVGVYNLKMDFNRRFLALREVKKRVVAEISAKVAKLRELSTALGIKEPLVEAVMQPDEVPENRELVSEEDMEDFLRRKEEDERKAAQGGNIAGFASATAGAKKAVSTSKPEPPKAGMADRTARRRADGIEGSNDGGGGNGGEDPLARLMAAVPLSELERSLLAYTRKRQEYMRSKLQAEVDEMVDAFDEALTGLRREKYKLEADVKLAEIRLLVMYQELQLLRDFEKRESVLLSKRNAKLDDRQEILDKIGECNDKMEQKKQELEGLLTRRAHIVSDFDSLVPEGDTFREALSKIFHRKIKRSKKKSGDEEEEEEEDDDDEGDDEEEEEEEEVEEEDGGEETCPSGCDHALYEKVCDLREKRLDEEDMITDFQKAMDGLKKEREGLVRKQKLVDGSLAAANGEIIEFQKEKQGRLNQIDVVVNLKMHQVEYLVDGRMPEDLSAGLVFSNHELERLKRRIDELEKEKSDLKLRQKELKKEHLQLLKDKRAKEERVEELEQRAYDVQMLKFGQVINMDLLDRIGVSKGTEELREQLRLQEAQYAKELTDWDHKIMQKTDELMELTRENTACLNVVSDLTAAQRKLETTLIGTRKTMFADPVANRRREVEERDALVALVNGQAAEIEKLKAQILALRRKDTSVYG